MSFLFSFLSCTAANSSPEELVDLELADKKKEDELTPAEMKARLARLRVENAQLRHELDHYHQRQPRPESPSPTELATVKDALKCRK